MGILMETTEMDLGVGGHSRRRADSELFGVLGAPNEFYADKLHTIALKTREAEFRGVEPIPVTLKTYQQFQTHGQPGNEYGFPSQQMINSYVPAPLLNEVPPCTSTFKPIPVKEEVKYEQKIRPPPKKKWIKEYLEEEPKSSPPPPVSVRVVTGLPVTSTPRSNGVVRPTTPVPPALPPCPPAAMPPVAVAIAVERVPAVAAVAPPPASLLDFAQEHSRPRTTSNSLGTPQIPSPPSVGSSGSSSNGSCSNGSVPRAGTREVHNKLEKNRRAHLKECFELLKRQLPATPDDKKTSNLAILGSAIRYIQVLRRKERECEHEMEKLAREKIAAQQRLAALKRDVDVRANLRRSIDSVTEEKEENVNGQVLGMNPISITSSPPRSVARMEASPPRTLNLSTKLRTLPIQITPTTSQVVRTSYGSRHNTLTLTTLAPADPNSQHGQQGENGLTNTLSTALVHPAQIHLPLSQVVSSGGLVVGPAALQLLSAGGGLRVLQAPVQTNGVTAGENNRIAKENGIISPTPVSEGGSVMVSGLTPIVVSQPGAHLLQTHTLTHKMVETQMVKGNMSPLTVSAQYLSATTIVKPVMVMSAPSAPHATHATHAPHAPST